MFSEKRDVPNLPNQSMVAISVMKLWLWKLEQVPGGARIPPAVAIS